MDNLSTYDFTQKIINNDERNYGAIYFNKFGNRIMVSGYTISHTKEEIKNAIPDWARPLKTIIVVGLTCNKQTNQISTSTIYLHPNLSISYSDEASGNMIQLSNVIYEI